MPHGRLRVQELGQALPCFVPVLGLTVEAVRLADRAAAGLVSTPKAKRPAWGRALAGPACHRLCHRVSQSIETAHPADARKPRRTGLPVYGPGWI